MTPADIIEQVRQIIQDSLSPQRFSDAVLLGFVNQTLRRMAVIRPDLFTTYGEITTTANAVAQSLPSGAIRLVELYQVKGGNALTEVDRASMDQGYPNWVSDPAGEPFNYIRHPRHPTKYFLYPRPVTGVVLMGEYADTPGDYTLSETIDCIPAVYLPTVTDGVVFLVSSTDDQHVNSQRASLFYDLFTTALTTGVSNRPLVDTESSGVGEMGGPRG